MRIRPALLVLSASLASTGAWAAPSKVEARTVVASVSVFLDQAAVGRKAEADIPAGDSIVLLHGFPASLVRDSLTARGTAASPVQIGSVDIRPVAQAATADGSRQANIRDRIRALDEKIRLQDSALAGFQAEKDMVSRYVGAVPADRAQAKDAQPGTAVPGPEQWKDAWSAVHQGATDSEAGRLQALSERSDLMEQRAALVAEFNLVSGKAPVSSAPSLDVAVAVHADEPAHLSLDLSYQTPDASWHPVYEARFDSKAGRMVLREEAVVTQRTGDDWIDVALTLSTARPSSGVEAPRPSTITVGLAKPVSYPGSGIGGMASSGSASSRMEDTSMLSAAPAPVLASRSFVAPVQAQDTSAIFDTSGLAVDYKIPGPTTIRSDGTEHRVFIADTAQDAVLEVQVVPHLEARAYLQARFSSKSDVPLMPGQVALYLDGVFVGRTGMALLRPAQEAVLPFGPDDQVQVTYEPQTVASAKEGWAITGHTAVVTRQARFSVHSFHPQAVPVTVLEELPVSNTDDLKVDMSADPAPDSLAFGGKQGQVAWTYSAKAGETRQFRFGYSLRAPDGMQITGLPRN